MKAEHLLLIGLGGLLTLPASGCSSCDPIPIVELPDGGRPDAGPPDAGAPPLRRLVERPLFGDLPVENRVFDPTFALPAFAWMVYDEYSLDVRFVRGRRHDAPTRTSSLIVGTSKPGYLLWTYGIARGGPAPLFVQVYLGGKAQAFSQTVRVYSVDPDGRSDPLVFAIPKARDPTLYQDDRGLYWMRYEGTIEADLPGWIMLGIAGSAPYEIAGPVIVQGSSIAGLARDLPPQVGPPRPATERERLHLQRIREHLARAQLPPALRRKARVNARLETVRRNARIAQQARAPSVPTPAP